VTLNASPTSVVPGSVSNLTWSSTNATSCLAGGSWSGTRGTSGTFTTSALTANSTFTLSCTGTGGTASTSTSVVVTAGGTKTGLDFPSNGAGNAFVAFQFLDPQNKGLPIWGPNNAGATYIWQVRPRQQTGYYATFWWSNNGDFLWEGGSPNSYYGAHPYPQSANDSGTTHWWEVATSFGGDRTDTLAGTKKTVVKDVWYTQALRVTYNADGTKTMVFYTSLPSVAKADVIEAKVVAGYGNVNPPKPALTFGDSPWWASFQHERLSGVLRGIKIFNKVLSESDTLAEAQSDQLSTAAGAANVWYMNINPTPSDISDKSGRGNHPSWADPANKAGLWTQ
jgi:hypothetical protein